MVVLLLRHEYTIQRCHIACGGGADYSGDARLIRIPIEWVKGKKITVQYNSNHAWPSTIFKHKRSFLRLLLGRTVQYNGRIVWYVQFWSTHCPVSVPYIENWPSFACFNFFGVACRKGGVPHIGILTAISMKTLMQYELIVFTRSIKS